MSVSIRNKIGLMWLFFPVVVRCCYFIPVVVRCCGCGFWGYCFWA